MKETPQLSWEALQKNKRRELERLSDLYRDNLEKADVKFIEGRARIVDPNTVEVNGQQHKVRPLSPYEMPVDLFDCYQGA